MFLEKRKSLLILNTSDRHSISLYIANNIKNRVLAIDDRLSVHHNHRNNVVTTSFESVSILHDVTFYLVRVRDI
jgi:hypothetical protein